MNPTQWAANADELLAEAPDTTSAWREIATAADRTATGGDDIDAFGRHGHRFPQLSPQAQAELAASHRWCRRATAALDSGEVRGRSAARVRAELHRRRHDTEYLLGAVFRLVRTIVKDRVRTRVGAAWADQLLADSFGDGYAIALAAADTYDPARGVAFSTWVATSVRNDVLDHIDAMVIHGAAPDSWFRVARIAAAVERDLQRDLGRVPSSAEVTDATWAECRRWAESKLTAAEAALGDTERAAVIDARLVKQGTAAALADLDRVRAALSGQVSLDAPVGDSADADDYAGSFADDTVDVAGGLVGRLDAARVGRVVADAIADLPGHLAGPVAERLRGVDGDGRSEAAVATRSLRYRIGAPHAQFASLAPDVTFTVEAAPVTAVDAFAAKLARV